MKKLFQNKAAAVLVIISIILVGTTSFISVLGYTSYVRNAIGIVLTPIQKGFNNAFDGVESFFKTKKDYEKLKEENEALKNQLTLMTNKLAKADLVLKENENLKDYLGIKSEHTDLVFVNAEITGRQSVSHNEIYTLNKGTRHGILPGMAVIDKNGVVGCITETGLTWSKAKTITSPGLSVGVTVDRTGDSGVLKGSFEGAKIGLCVMTLLKADCDVRTGDLVVTSENSSMYPAGLVVGRVEKTEYDGVSRELIVYITPASNLTEVESVMIITDYDILYE